MNSNVYLHMSNIYKQEWEQYCTEELSLLTPLLSSLGFTLEEEQPHLKGERYLMQAVQTTSGKKLILLGKDSKGLRVVIKATRDAAGSKELEHEQTCRQKLHEIQFAYQVFLTPEEILFTHKDGFTISIQKFIEQQTTFLERPLEEQFTLALRAFKAQESAHAATYEHLRRIEGTFGSIDAKGYIKAYKTFASNIEYARPDDASLSSLLKEGHAQLEKEMETIEQYSGFLTHTDFVPHNIRVLNDDIYLLDHSSLRFGNKYEGWARFLNFMALYNPELEKALLDYVKMNRTPEEYRALWLMRIFRLAEIIWFYVNMLQKTEGDQKVLTEARIQLWKNVLEAALKEETVSASIVSEYKVLRDSLRTAEEKQRQVGLH